jgi:hypothetical protein
MTMIKPNIQVFTPFNPAADEFLTANGYVWSRHPAFWEDVGDPENGPKIHGWAEHDLYESEESDIIVVIYEDGKAEVVPYVPDPPEFAEQDAERDEYERRLRRDTE